jgi:hypothetical protein
MSPTDRSVNTTLRGAGPKRGWAEKLACKGSIVTVMYIGFTTVSISEGSVRLTVSVTV